MRLGYSVGGIGSAAQLATLDELIRKAERLGYDSIWSSEVSGTDPVSVLGWLAARTERVALGSAVLQISARAAVTAAATALTLQRLSGGRLILGLGTSGPQVVEGWHGQPYGRPLARARDYVAVLRMAMAGEPISYCGQTLALPLPGGQATEMPMASAHGVQPPPVYLAGIGRAAVALAGELGDGWLGIHCPPSYVSQARGWLADGAARRGHSLEAFTVAVMVQVLILDDHDLARDMMRPWLALFLGGMGTRQTNYYNRLAGQLGFRTAASRVQEAYLAGDLDEAMAALPDDLVDEMSVCGPADHVRRRLAAYDAAGTDVLIAGIVAPTAAMRHEQLERLAELTRG
ncbi:MAG TPA: LLM class flavin-dependent oxidoreductase [Streptosporangiaceae bacterium]|nr:LLM class flavin-dependent oxidoreductase [Streptosporangiaceae bacterium]